MSTDPCDNGLSEVRTTLGLERSALTLVVGAVMSVRLVAEGFGVLALVAFTVPAVPAVWGLAGLGSRHRTTSAPAWLVASAVACTGLAELVLLTR